MITALITGAAGQDGVLLSRLLLAEGARVVGVVRSEEHLQTVPALAPGLELVQGDITDRGFLARLVDDVAPDEVYNLAAFSSVARSWVHVDEVMRVNVTGVVNVLEVLRERHQAGHPVRFLQASSSEMFGLAAESPQRETTPFHPRSPYAVSKAAAHLMTLNYRESYGMFACSPILYNHESPLREPHFVTRKITQGAARIARGLQDSLVLGNLDVTRDWGWAPDSVRAMRAMLLVDQPQDLVVATGESHTLVQFLAAAFRRAGIGEWSSYVDTDPALRRPVEIRGVVGDATRAREALGWHPMRTFEDTVAAMVDHDLALIDDPGALWFE